MKLKSVFFSLAAILIFAVGSFSQEKRIADDNAMTDQLRKEGVKYETKRAIVWTEKDSLTQAEIQEFGKLANQGIIDIEKYSGIKFDKKHFKANKIEYFLSSKAGISHISIESKPFIYIRPIRVKEKKTMYLHETTHIIAWKSLKSLWLQEGFPNYIQTYVSRHYGGYLGSPFNPEDKPIDELARNHLKEEISKKVLPLIGRNGTPYDFNLTEEEWKIYSFILEDRQVAAPAFYNLSESFVKFIVEKVGMKKMRKILEPQDTRAAIEKVTGKNMDEWKTDWLKSLAK